MVGLSLIHISEPTRQEANSYAVFCLKKKREEIDYFPTNSDDLKKCKPIFKKLKGWQCSTADCRKLSDLPQNAMNYLRFLAELMEVPIAIVSLGANRDQTIVIEDPIHGPKRALLR